jgi:phosphoglycolate phosphatase-like HAD superfamily hydrolase
MWDVDGVLVNLDHTYFRFLKEHPNYRDQYRDLRWEDLSQALPIDPRFGSLELKTHPIRGKELDNDFCHNSYGIYFDRPLYTGVREVLKELDKFGYFQLTMSSGFNGETKRRMITNILGNDLSFVKIEVVEHDKSTATAGDVTGMIGEKETRILECLKKYNLVPDETVLIDDRVFNCETAKKVGMRAVRCTPGFTTPTPVDKIFDAEVKNVMEFKNWLLTHTTKGNN